MPKPVEDVTIPTIQYLYNFEKTVKKELVVQPTVLGVSTLKRRKNMKRDTHKIVIIPVLIIRGGMTCMNCRPYPCNCTEYIHVVLNSA